MERIGERCRTGDDNEKRAPVLITCDGGYTYKEARYTSGTYRTGDIGGVCVVRATECTLGGGISIRSRSFSTGAGDEDGASAFLVLVLSEERALSTFAIAFEGAGMFEVAVCTVPCAAF